MKEDSGREMRQLWELADIFFDGEFEKSRNDMDCMRRALVQFCKTGSKSDAFCVYYCFCEIFGIFGKGYDTMSKLLEFLSDHEYHSGELLAKHRDHYSHSVYVFALGLAVYACDSSFRDIFDDVYCAERYSAQDFLYYWGLTALFHDIGYPFQLAHEQIRSYAEDMWGSGNPDNPYVSYENMEPLLALKGGMTTDVMLAEGIHRRLGYPTERILPLLHDRHKNKPKFMDHAYFSAVLLAHRLNEAGMDIDMMKQDVLTAIALHNNLNRFDIRAALGEDTAVPARSHPLAYLLILCDELQNWDRTPFGNISKKDPLAWKVELAVSSGSVSLAYIFDSFTVLDTAASEDADGKERVTEVRRANVNVEALRSGKFLRGIEEKVRCHAAMSVVAEERTKHKKVCAFASSDKFVDLCDFARAIHMSYRAEYGGPEFDKLSLEFKLSNIEQAKSYADKLELINCFYSDKELDYPVIKEFTRSAQNNDGSKRDDLGFLAREEHLRWVREKLAAGWRYGTDYSSREERDEKKIHRSIIPFDCLPESERAKDELMIANMVPFLYHYGHGVRIYSYRLGLKPVLDIAACGHRTVKDTQELRGKITDILRRYQEHYRVVLRCNFAYGADLIVADCANELGITLKAALPLPYEEHIAKVRENSRLYGYPFTDEDELRMRHLLAQAVSCKIVPDPRGTYNAAAKYLIGNSSKLIALWDGVQTILTDGQGNAVNRGGTWHKICLAKNSRGMTDADIHIIPCER